MMSGDRYSPNPRPLRTAVLGRTGGGLERGGGATLSVRAIVAQFSDKGVAQAGCPRYCGQRGDATGRGVTAVLSPVNSPVPAVYPDCHHRPPRSPIRPGPCTVAASPFLLAGGEAHRDVVPAPGPRHGGHLCCKTPDEVLAAVISASVDTSTHKHCGGCSALGPSCITARPSATELKYATPRQERQRDTHTTWDYYCKKEAHQLKPLSGAASAAPAAAVVVVVAAVSSPSAAVAPGCVSAAEVVGATEDMYPPDSSQGGSPRVSSAGGSALSGNSSSTVTAPSTSWAWAPPRPAMERREYKLEEDEDLFFTSSFTSVTPSSSSLSSSGTGFYKQLLHTVSVDDAHMVSSPRASPAGPPRYPRHREHVAAFSSTGSRSASVSSDIYSPGMESPRYKCGARPVDSLLAEFLPPRSDPAPAPRHGTLPDTTPAPRHGTLPDTNPAHRHGTPSSDVEVTQSRSATTRELAPYFIIKPRRQLVDEGEAARLKVSCDGDPPPHVCWQRHGRRVTEGHKYQFEERNGFHYLTISNISPQDAGDYECVLTNAAGTTAATTNLEVFAKPKPLKSLKLKAGASSAAPVSARPNRSSPRENSSSGRKTSAFSRVSHAFRTNDGDRDQSPLGLRSAEAAVSNSESTRHPLPHGTPPPCPSSEDTGSKRRRPRRPTGGTPVVQRSLVNVTAVDGERVSLQCIIEGEPVPEVHWFSEEREVRPLVDEIELTYDGRHVTLTFCEVFPEDAGLYRCVAENCHGHVHTSCSLIVTEPLPLQGSTPPPIPVAPPPQEDSQRPLAISRKLQDLVVNDGDRVELVVDVKETTSKSRREETSSRFEEISQNTKPGFSVTSVIDVPAQKAATRANLHKTTSPNPDGKHVYRPVSYGAATDEATKTFSSSVTIINTAPVTVPVVETSVTPTTLKGPGKSHFLSKVGVQIHSDKSNEETVIYQDPHPKVSVPKRTQENTEQTARVSSTTLDINEDKKEKCRAVVSRVLGSKIIPIIGEKVNVPSNIESSEVFMSDKGIYSHTEFYLTGRDSPTLNQVTESTKSFTMEENNNVNECGPKRMTSVHPVVMSELSIETSGSSGSRGKALNSNERILKESTAERSGSQTKADSIRQKFEQKVGNKDSSKASENQATAGPTPGKVSARNFWSQKVSDSPEPTHNHSVSKSKPSSSVESKTGFLKNKSAASGSSTITLNSPREVKQETGGSVSKAELLRQKFEKKEASGVKVSKDITVDSKTHPSGISEKKKSAFNFWNKKDTETEDTALPKSSPRTIGKLGDASSLSQKPEFIRKPQNVEVEEGNCAKFVCQVKNLPRVNVRWEKDGVTIRNSDRIKLSCRGCEHELQIVHTLATDVGRYDCVAVSSHGDARGEATLSVRQIDVTSDVTDIRRLLQTRPELKQLSVESSVQELHAPVQPATPPAVLTPLTDQRVAEGQAVTLSCVLQAHPTPNITWKHNSREIKESRYFQQVYTDEGSAQLLVAEAYPEDNGEYTCTATNHLGTASSSCQLCVHEIENSTPHVQVVPDQPVKQNWPTRQDDHSDRERHPSSLEEIPEDTTNGVPNEDKHSSTIDDKQETEQAIDPSESLADPFTVSEPESSLSPRSDSTPQDVSESELHSPAQRNISSFETFVVDDATPDEDSSMVSSVVEEPVEEPPFIEDLSPDNIEVLQGQGFEMTARFLGYPTPCVTWLKDKIPLLSDSRVLMEQTAGACSLHVVAAGVGDTGCYTLVLCNTLGEDRVSSSVTVQDKPNSPVRQPFISNITQNSLTLAWYGPSYDGGTSVIHYRVESSRGPAGDWSILTSQCKHTSYHVTDLEPNSEYRFRVSAANVHGFSDPGKPTNLVVTLDNSQSEDGTEVEIQGGEQDLLPFEPRVVHIKPGRKYDDFYDVGAQIGRGKFGSVCICVDKATSRTYAAKFIKVRTSQKVEVKKEVEVMNKLHHPKLLLLWDAFESLKEIVLIMEHVAGGELFERIIDEDYILTERECVHFMRQICDGVKFMHSHNILHLDLKPENILCITKNSNEVKIIDFGLAREYDPSTTTKVMFGTPEFVAPEVVNYDEIGYTTDMWSVGVVCYILMSGLSPFLGENDGETFSNVTMATWDFDDETFDEISEDAKDFISNLLVQHPGGRMEAEASLQHKWLSQDVKFMRAKRLSTEKHKKFMARQRWQRTGTAIRALGRMTSLQKIMFNPDSGRSSMTRSRSGSTISDSGSTSSSGSGSRLPPKWSPASDSGIADTRKQKFERRCLTEEVFSDSVRPPSPLTAPVSSAKTIRGNNKDTDNDFVKSENKNGVSCAVNGNSSHAGLNCIAETSCTLSEVDGSHVESEKESCAPEFTKKVKDFDVFEGDSARFDAQVSGHPLPNVTWLKDGVALNEDRRHLVDSDDDGHCHLVIKECVPDDDGRYECLTVNHVGEARCSADLYVESAGDES